MLKIIRRWFAPLAVLGCLLPLPAIAQITPAVGGTGTTVTVNGQQFDIGGGAFSRDGKNLFHLFKQFGLSDGQIANFLSNSKVQNILAGVNGGDVSYINGLIQVIGGNSNLYLLNPAGIVFGPNAQLNVPAAFHASTAQRVHFDGGIFDINGFNDYANLVGNPTGFEFLSTGIIVNEGNLAVGPGQNLTLMGHQVFNTGTLSAPGGTITIQAIPETGMVRISQEGMILSLEIPADRIPEDGVIEAVDLPRLITGGEDRPRVNSVVHNADGTISLVHDPNRVNVPVDGATAVASGTMDVSSPEGVGGQINVLGSNVAFVNAQLNASGGAGGGTILGGGDYLGGSTGTGRLDSSFNTQNLFVDSNTVMNADALIQGDGGTVINWADNSTIFHGFISAQGGILGGDGGFAEVSGRETLQMSGFADLRAPQGAFGTLLLDPGSVTIQAGSNTYVDKNTFYDLYLNSQLSAASVTIATSEATNSNPETITIGGSTYIIWSAATTLTLTAGRNIFMNAGAVIRNTHTGTSFDAIVFNANTAGTATGSFAGIQLNGAGATLAAQDGNIRLTGHGGNSGANDYGIYQLGSAQVSTTGTGNITYIGTGGNGTSSNYGILLNGANTTISSSDGSIALTGTGRGNGTGNYGIYQLGAAQVSSTSGNITYTGTGGNGTSNNYGILLTGANTTITSGNGTIALTGTGQGNGNGTRNRGISHEFGAQVSTTGTGNITYIGTGGNGTDFNFGILLSGANTTISSSDGTIALTGTGQGNGNWTSNRGISQESGAQVRSTGNGTITYTGTGGNGTDSNFGILLSGTNTTVSSSDGAIALTGTGGGNETSNYGIYQLSAAQVRSTGNGTITYTGTGGNGTDSNFGILLSGTNTTVSSQGGEIALTGTGQGNGSSNRGISQEFGVQVSTTGTGNITYIGTGGNGTSSNYGIYLGGTNATISSQGGAIALTGTGQGNGTSNFGIYQLSAAQVRSTGNGTITYEGTSGNGTNNNYGIYLIGANTRITSETGNISLTGNGGSGSNSTNDNYGIWQRLGAQVFTSGDITLTGNGGGGSNSTNNNYGIFQESGAQVFTTGNGNITYRGTGGNGTDRNYGILLEDANTTIASETGIIHLTGNGTGNGIYNYGIFQGSGAQVFTGNGTPATSLTGGGNITYTGTGGSGTFDNYGILLEDANTTIASGAGAINLTGNGSGTVDGNHGIRQRDGARVFTTGNGNITYTGTGSSSGTSINLGIYLEGANTTIASGAGTITLTGNGRATGADNYGILQRSGVQVFTGTGTPTTSLTGGGNITYTGTGSNGTSSNFGINLEGDVNGTPIIASGSGNITLTGNGGSGSNSTNDNYGIWQRLGAQVFTTGDITLTGNGGGTTTNNYGIFQESGAQVFTTGNGNITYTGTGANGADAIRVQTGTNLIGKGTTGNITLMGDTMTLNNVSIQGTVNLLIQPLTPATTIGIGDGATGILNLNATELGNIQDGFSLITIGHGNGTGLIQVAGTVHPFNDNLQLRNSSGGIQINSALNVGANNLILNSGGTVTQTAPIIAQGVAITGSGDTTLDHPNNQIQTIAANTIGNITVVTGTDLAVDTVNPDGIENSQTVVLQSTTGNITLNQPINATQNITLAADQNFINNAGVNALIAGGRWLVYATSPEGNINGWSVLGGSQQFSTAYPTPSGFAGNGFVYSVAAPPLPPVTSSPVILSTAPTINVPAVPSPPSSPAPPMAPTSSSSGSAPPIIFTPTDLPLPSNLSTILQGQEEEEMPLEQSLCQLLEEGEETVLEINGVPVESVLAEQCR
ncbi:filamentous hemagglutinin N-terminal domain-containing protein [Candidatus Synechococcus calcipolaris G9]|uniref:Filamentous hemagglutinin N-terminal domain-containing protein n=1 Tax=Candidatus Synechococcus calcipolaris G9 TaxID=1497997 RepID=A0ABT6F263_9SYNE|nr:filamentous hemagglutinin N-terminal domain-containing protein [Candidatus Synechococcus calcipolaris]MDG2991924.1 filamentous hemagglutinin N-terminal domain-containing protein [Candidatus Synechococcus calcipolaris G9]